MNLLCELLVYLVKCFVVVAYFCINYYLRAAICKNRPKVCKIKKIEKFQKNPKHSPR